LVRFFFPSLFLEHNQADRGNTGAEPGRSALAARAEAAIVTATGVRTLGVVVVVVGVVVVVVVGVVVVAVVVVVLMLLLLLLAGQGGDSEAV
jgi:hypothetical protein